jgi:hypothetical protein
MSYADRLRRELLKAGVTRRELHHETATTLPVDFHSTRRAYATALARLGVNEQTAMVLTGHTDPKVHQRYVDAQTVDALPAAAVADLNSNGAFRCLLGLSRPKNRACFLERDTGFEPADHLAALCLKGRCRLTPPRTCGEPRRASTTKGHRSDQRLSERDTGFEPADHLAALCLNGRCRLTEL